MQLAIDLLIILVFVVGFGLFRNPAGARRGNFLAALAFAAAVGYAVSQHGLSSWPLVAAVVLVTGLLGWYVAARVSMLHIPAMVAFQNGAGGLAALLISLVELLWVADLAGLGVLRVSALLGVGIGGVTVTGSAIAGGKLAGLLHQPPTVLKGHNIVILGTLLAAVAATVVALLGGPGIVVGGLALVVTAGALGVLFAIRVGGADMPVLISFLNATSGLAAAFCGVATGSRLLVAGGAFVAASGTILTIVMCRAMNRSLANVFVGGTTTGAAAAPEDWLPMVEETVPGESPEAASETPAATTVAPMDEGEPFDRACAALRGARKVIIVPGYGMALAQAQFDVVALSGKLVSRGAEVKYAIHPVAGRMPGHMNVLLAEADADYEDLLELDDGNAQLELAEVAIVVGASDVVNPAAVELPGTPISGMPILRVQDAARVIICNLDNRPGYSGVPNRLYDDKKVIPLFGDAKETFERFLAAFDTPGE